MTEKQKIKQIEVLGHQIDLDRIENPHVRRAIRERANCFLFNYGDNKHSDAITSKTHSDSNGSHTDYKSYGDYSERSGHTDESKDSPVQSYHVDRTSGHEDYNEHSDNSYPDIG